MEKLASQAGIEVTGLLNTKSKAFRSIKLDPEHITPRQAGELISQNPRIMRRPLLTDGKTLVVGFKPEEMERLLQSGW